MKEIVRLGACVAPARNGGSSIVLFGNWSGGDGRLTLLAKLQDVDQIFIRAPLTDDSIEHLAKLTTLTYISIESGCQITDAGSEELQKALPNANIRRKEY